MDHAVAVGTDWDKVGGGVDLMSLADRSKRFEVVDVDDPASSQRRQDASAIRRAQTQPGLARSSIYLPECARLPRQTPTPARRGGSVMGSRADP